MNVARRQRGFGMVGWFFVIAVAAFFLTILFKLFPVYMEHMSVAQSLKMLGEEREARSPNEIRTSLFKRLQVNNVENITRENVEIVRDNNAYVVTVAYEVRVPFARNISILVSFNDKAEVPAS